MKGWIRIILVVFVLVGGVAFFGYWSIDQFNLAFDNFSTPYLASTHSAYQSFKRPDAGLASTSPETLGDVATSTEMSGGIATSTKPELTSTSTVSALSFTFPKSNTQAYIGCTYPVAWESSLKVGSMEAALVDAGTRTAVGPNTSGLAKENIIKEDSQKLSWKVGSVWSGSYYIKISKINGADAEIRSKVFVINKMPENIGASEQRDTCKESGGLL